MTAVLTDNDRDLCGKGTHPCEPYLELSGIEYRRTRVMSPGTNGFVERLTGTVPDEVFCLRLCETFSETVEALQTDLDAWLLHYDTERLHPGHRNQGRRPIETINDPSAKKPERTCHRLP